jgi:hypothetical protein
MWLTSASFKLYSIHFSKCKNSKKNSQKKSIYIYIYMCSRYHIPFVNIEFGTVLFNTKNISFISHPIVFNSLENVFGFCKQFDVRFGKKLVFSKEIIF